MDSVKATDSRDFIVFCSLQFTTHDGRNVSNYNIFQLQLDLNEVETSWVTKILQLACDVKKVYTNDYVTKTSTNPSSRVPKRRGK